MLDELPKISLSFLISSLGSWLPMELEIILKMHYNVENLFVYGYPGIGKSSLVSKIIYEPSRVKTWWI